MPAPTSLFLAVVFAAGGLAVLAGGGEFLVRGAINASRLMRVSPVVIGLTVVAFATSLPELAVSLLAAHRGSPDVAVGNVVGSNMFNIAVIVGISAILFAPLRFRSRILTTDVGVMILAAVALIASGWNGFVGRREGVLLLICLVAFLWVRARGARDPDPAAGEDLGTDAEISIETHAKKRRGVALSLAMIFVGAGLLTGGAELLVRGAVFIAREKGISERVIGITLVSAGTGLPELVTAIIAGIRKHPSVAIGNVIGSNIFNVFGILGTVALVHPIPASARIIHADALWMLGFSLFLLIPVLKPSRRMSKFEGAALLAGYAAYLFWLFRN